VRTVFDPPPPPLPPREPVRSTVVFAASSNRVAQMSCPPMRARP